MRVAALAARGKHHNCGSTRDGLPFEPLYEAKPVHLRHVHVSEYEIEGLALFGRGLIERKSLFPITGDYWNHAPMGENALQDAPIGAVVIDNQHFGPKQNRRRDRDGPGSGLSATILRSGL